MSRTSNAVLSRLTVGALVSLMSAAPAFAQGGTPAKPETWNGNASQVQLSSLERLQTLMDQDTQTHALLAQAMGKVGAHSLREFAKVVKLCSSDTPSDVQGRATPGAIEGEIFFRTADSLVENQSLEKSYEDEINRFRHENRAVDVIAKLTPGFAVIKVQVDPVICIRSNIPMDEAFITFVHELTHFAKMDNLSEIDMLSFKNENEFLMNSVSQKGSEVDAYIAEFRSFIRKEKNRDRLPILAKSLFNDDGLFVGTRGELAKIILKPKSQGGFGYAEDSLKGEYANQLNSSYQREIQERNNIVDGINNLQENIAVDERNHAAYQHNLPIYQEEKDQKSIDEANKALDRLAKLIPGRKAILESDLKEIGKRDARINEYKRRFF